MSKTSLAFVLCLVVGAGSLASCCCKKPAPSPSAPAPQAAAKPVLPHHPVLARVNGVAFTDLDVAGAFRARSPEDEPTPAIKASILETLIRQELLAQRAAALGLDKDEQLQEELAAIQAKMDKVRRDRLAEASYRDAIAKMPPVSDADAKAYFDANAARIHTEIHVSEIMERSEQAIAAAQAELKGGMSFEDVALKHQKVASPGKTPWDQGFLMWKQVPDAWHPAVDKLAVGEVSDILRGPGGRFWLVKMLGRKENTTTFDELKAMLIEDLRAAKMDTVRDDLDRSLLATAKIERVKQP